jgi:hypothetical protein
MAQISELMTANARGAIRYPTAAEVQLMSAVEVMTFAMHKLAISGSWEAAARVAAELAPYCHHTAGVRAVAEEHEHCHRN